jgi:glycosyltransferase involved in cell wall biosynthesis
MMMSMSLSGILDPGTIALVEAPAQPRVRARTATRSRPRILLIAEACNPDMTSVPLVGYSHCKAIKQYADALVLTHWRNRPALLNVGWVEGKDFAIIDTEWAARGVWKLCTFLRGGTGAGWTTLAALTVPLYYLFEHYVWHEYGPRLLAGEFDIVHRMVPLSPTTPSTLARKCREIGVPFVIGPLNGGLPWPKGFDTERRKEREWLSYVRSAYKLLPGYRAMRHSAAAILVASRDTLRQMPREHHDRCFYIPENAIDPARFARRQPRERKPGEPIRVVFLGRLVPYKGADMLIEAAAPLVKAGTMAVNIVGDGPQMPELREIVARLGVEKGVRLSGWVDHRQVQQYLAEADVFGFPSIREFGGAVVLEAMALGVVPIIVNYGGPAELVTPETGWLLELGRREQIVEELRKTLARLVDNSAEIDAKREPAERRAREMFTWENKARQVMQVYRWVLGQARQKPVFPMPV